MRRIHVSKKDEVNYELLKEKIKQVLEKNGTILDQDLYVNNGATDLEKIQVHKKNVSFVIPDLPEKEKEEVENCKIKRRRKAKKMTKSSGSKNASLASTTVGSGPVTSKTAGSKNSNKQNAATELADSNARNSNKKRRERKPEIVLEPPTPPEVETMVSQVPHSSDSEPDDKGKYLKVPVFRRNRSRKSSLNSNQAGTVPLRKKSPMDRTATETSKENPKASTPCTMDSKSKLVSTRKKKKKKTSTAETKLESSLTKTENDKSEIKSEETTGTTHESYKIDQGLHQPQDKTNGITGKSKRNKDSSKKKDLPNDDSKSAGNSNKPLIILNKTVPRDQPYNDVGLKMDLNKSEVVFQKIDSHQEIKAESVSTVSARPRSKGKRDKSTKIATKEDKDDQSSVLCNLAYKKMTENGCAIKLSTLQRGLLTPTEIKKLSRHRTK